MRLDQPLGRPAPIGLMAPDFTAEAFFPDRDAAGEVRLSDYRGHWVLLHFYSSDFTFV